MRVPGPLPAGCEGHPGVPQTGTRQLYGLRNLETGRASLVAPARQVNGRSIQGLEYASAPLGLADLVHQQRNLSALHHQRALPRSVAINASSLLSSVRAAMVSIA